MPEDPKNQSKFDLTVLKSACGTRVNKSVRWTDIGVVTERNYPQNLTWWTRAVHSVTFDIDALAAFIADQAAQPDKCLVTGTPINLERWALDQKAPRWKSDRGGEGSASLGECASPWMPVDIDNIHTGIRLDPLDPEPAIAAVVEQIGAPFNAASYVWQVTSSASPGSEYVRCRLYFLIDQDITNTQRRAWAGTVNARTGLKLVDPAPFSANQPIYLALPEFLGGADPFPRRIGVTYGEHEVVRWSEVTIQEKSEYTYTGTRAGGPIPAGIDERLARIGDGPGQEGFDAPIFDAIVAMVRARWIADRIIGAIQDAVSNTVVDPIKHRPEYLERKTHPMEIRRQIRNAENFQKKTETLPRVTQTRKVADVLPLAEAEKRMRQVARDFYNADKPTKKAIFATVGLGKTRALADELPAGKRILWAHATHEQGAEVQVRMNDGLKRVANKIEGRRANEKRGSPGLCQRQNVLAEIHEAGLDPFAERIACKSPNGDLCEHYLGCEYFRQFNRCESVRMVPHAYLGGSMQRSRVYNADFIDDVHGLVCDENPLAELVGSANYLMTEVATTSPILAAALVRIRNGGALPPETMQELEAQSTALCGVAIPTMGAAPQDEWQLIRALRELAARRKPRYRAIFNAVKAHQAGATNLLWFGTDKEKRERVFCAWKNELHPSLTHGLFLDATGSEDVYRALLGDDVEFEYIHAEQNLEIIQAQDAPVGKRSLGIDDPDSDGILARATALARMLGAGFISNRSAVEAAMERGYLDQDAPIGWFGALRGLNRLEGLDTLVIAGRPEPRACDVEGIARALWPTETLNLTGRYEWRQDGLLSVASHADPRCDAVLRMIRESEIHQAIGRLRAVRSKTLKRVVLLTATPVDLPTITKSLREILPTEGMARLFHAGNGVAPMVPTLMAKLCSDVWETAGAAEQWLVREKPTKHYLSTSNYKIVGFKFRLRGQRRWSWALSGKDELDTWAELERITGQEVVACQQYTQPPVWSKPAFTVTAFQFNPAEASPPQIPAWAKLALPIPHTGDGATLSAVETRQWEYCIPNQIPN